MSLNVWGRAPQQLNMLGWIVTEKSACFQLHVDVLSKLYTLYPIRKNKEKKKNMEPTTNPKFKMWRLF